MLVLEGVVEVEQFRMVQLVHDADLTFDGVLVERIRSVDELGDEVSSGRFLDGPVHHAERSAACNNRLLKRPSMTECRARGHIGQMIKYDEIYKSYEKSIHNNAMQCPCSNDRHYVCQNFLITPRYRSSSLYTMIKTARK